MLESLDWPDSLSEQRAAALCAACATVSRLPAQTTAARFAKPNSLSSSAAQEWQAEQESGWLRAVHEAHPQQVLRAGESLEKVSSSLGAEEARWRAGTAALQQHWQDEARAMMARWQAEDAGRLQQAMEEASSESATFERLLGALPPPVRPGWPQLREATRLEAVGPARVAELARRELSGSSSGGGGSSSSSSGGGSGSGGSGGRGGSGGSSGGSGGGGRAVVPAVSGSPDVFGVDAARVQQLLRALHGAGGGAALCDARVGGALFEALRTSTHAVARTFGANGGLDAPPRGGREGDRDRDRAALVPAAAVVCALLTLVGGAAPVRRLDALTPWILAQSNVVLSAADTSSSSTPAAGSGAAGGGGGGGVPLTLAQQRALFATFYVAAAAADAAARHMSRAMLEIAASPPTTSPQQQQPQPQQPPPTQQQQQRGEREDAEAPHAQPVGGALRRAMERRPQTWALAPPTARDFLVWCAACEPIIGAALAEGAAGS